MGVDRKAGDGKLGLFQLLKPFTRQQAVAGGFEACKWVIKGSDAGLFRPNSGTWGSAMQVSMERALAENAVAEAVQISVSDTVHTQDFVLLHMYSKWATSRFIRVEC